MIRNLQLAALIAMTATSAPGPVIVIGDDPPPPPAPPPTSARKPTAHDEERQRLAALKRAQRAARIAKGFRHG